MRFFLILNLIIISLIGYSQTEFARLPIKIKDTYDIYEKTNKEGNHSFFFDLDDKYLFVITDSAYNEVYKVKDSYYSSVPVSLVGTIATDSSFIYYFKRNIENELYILNVDYKNKKVYRKKGLKIYSSGSFELREYININNRLFLLTTSKRENNINFFEVVNDSKVIEYNFLTDGPNGRSNLKNGLFNNYSLDSESFNFLVQYSPQFTKEEYFNLYKFNLSTKTFSEREFRFSNLFQNEKSKRDNFIQTSTITDTSVYIASIRNNGDQISINRYSLFNDSITGFFSISLRQLITERKIVPYIVNHTGFDYFPANAIKIVEYLGKPYNIKVYDYSPDTISITITFYNRYYYHEKLYDTRMRVSLNVNKKDFSFINIDSEDSLYKAYSFPFKILKNKRESRPIGGMPAYIYFVDYKLNFMFGYIDSKSKEFVITRLIE